MDRQIRTMVFAVPLLALPPSSFWDNIVANPAATLGVVGALVAALVTLVTFMFNFRATVRNQQDAQFYEALKRFGDQTSPVLRSSAAGLLAQMAGRTSLFRRPYFVTTLDQLTMGLLIETDRIVLESVGRAFKKLVRLEPHRVIRALRAINLKLQEDVVTLLAHAFALKGAKHVGDCESHWDLVALLSPFATAEVKTLVQVPENSKTFANSLTLAAQDYQSFSNEKRIDLTSEVRERLRLAGRRLKENCRLIDSVLFLIVPFLSYVETKRTKSGYKTFRKIPLLKRYRRRVLSLDQVFLPGISFQGRFINKVSFTSAVLVGASFKHALVLGTSFDGAYLRGADFSGALLKSSKLGRTIFGGFRSINRTHFREAQLQGADFRSAEFFKAVMYKADITGAKMYAALVVDDAPILCWTEVNWWKADYDQGDHVTFDRERAEVTTNDALKLLHRDYGKELPTDPEDLHSSIREFVATRTR